MNFVVLIQFLSYMYNYFKDPRGKIPCRRSQDVLAQNLSDLCETKLWVAELVGADLRSIDLYRANLQANCGLAGITGADLK
jgi:hypothetical protein